LSQHNSISRRVQTDKIESGQGPKQEFIDIAEEGGLAGNSLRPVGPSMAEVALVTA
jgi:hypothetical protein